MSRRQGSGGRRGRHVSEDEAELWSHTTRSIEPLQRKKSRVRKPAANRTGSEPTPAPKPSAADAGRDLPAAKPQPPRPRHHPPPVKTIAKPATPLPAFEPRQARAIASGKIEIEGRIDLHGHRQAEAHGILRAFLHASYARGRRLVLVITGKGAERDRAGDALSDLLEMRERGVLRRNVPRWLEEPELRAIVLSYTTAAIRHGGEGALYVRLRRRPGATG